MREQKECAKESLTNETFFFFIAALRFSHFLNITLCKAQIQLKRFLWIY